MFTFAGREGYFSSGPVIGRAGHNYVPCKTCNVLLCVLEQLRVDNSSSGPNWEKFVQLDECRSCPFSV